MLLAIAGALLPILFVVGLGWLAARTGIIPAEAAGHFAAFVVNFALPLALFLAAAAATPAELSNLAYIGAMIVGLIGTFGIGIALGRLAFGHDIRASTIQGLGCGFPNMAYCGPPVLGAVVGPTGILAVLIGNLVTSLIMIPVSLVLLHGGKAGTSGTQPSEVSVIGSSLLGAVKQPLVWPARCSPSCPSASASPSPRRHYEPRPHPHRAARGRHGLRRRVLRG